MLILFLHGWHSVVGGIKLNYLRESGHEVVKLHSLITSSFSQSPPPKANKINTKETKLSVCPVEVPSH